MLKKLSSFATSSLSRQGLAFSIVCTLLSSGCGGNAGGPVSPAARPVNQSSLLPPSDVRLRTPVHPLGADQVTTVAVQRAIERLYDATKPYRPPNKLKLVGLAAPQIGIDLPIILVDMGIKEDGSGSEVLTAFINPVITWKSDDLVEGKEGCFSVKSQLIGRVSRANHIKISAQDQYGRLISQELSGFTARIFQHEVDHLHGLRFPDRVGEAGILHWVEAEQLASYVKNWRSWPAFPWNGWIEMKLGTHSSDVKNS